MVLVMLLNVVPDPFKLSTDPVPVVPPMLSVPYVNPPPLNVLVLTTVLVRLIVVDEPVKVNPVVVDASQGVNWVVKLIVEVPKFTVLVIVPLILISVAVIV